VGLRCAQSAAPGDTLASALADSALVARFCQAYQVYRSEAPCP
jgi:hypothetical protein